MPGGQDRREGAPASFDERLAAMFDFVDNAADPADDEDDEADPDDDPEDVADDGAGEAAGSVQSGSTDEPPTRRRPDDATREHTDGERLQKVLAQAGVGSRRTCEELIRDGLVRVNGQRVELGCRVDPEADLITVNGAPVPTKSGLVHYLLNKPTGVVTTASDEHGRRTVIDLVPESPRVYPVGRLDVDTEGLLIITNNGELAHRLMHPSYGVEKEYLAKVRGRPQANALQDLRDGVELDDGLTAPAKAVLVGPDLVRLTIHEGRNRQVRRMLDAVGHPVLRLARTRIGPIADRQLPPGEWRHLTEGEIAKLAHAVRTTRKMRRAEQF